MESKKDVQGGILWWGVTRKKIQGGLKTPKGVGIPQRSGVCMGWKFRFALISHLALFLLRTMA